MIDQPIAEFMNRDVLKGEGSTLLSDVVAMMSAEVQSAFIVCDGGTPVGVITERDVVQVLDGVFSGRCFDDVRAEEVMASPVHTLPETATMGEVIRVMSSQRFRRVPIVDDKHQLSGIVNLMELQGAMNAALERRGRDLEVAVMERTAELQAANAKLEALSVRDGLTGLLNRRAMTQKLGELHALAQRYGNCYAVILIDVDYFKLYNDTQGHLAGDSTLKLVANVLDDSVRISDSVYRYGGEEFLILLPESDGESARLVSERVQKKLASREIPHPESPISEFVTLSVGLAEVATRECAREQSWERTVERADRALYRAKQQGRNRIVGPEEP
ncbi:MAG TPA: GGDEF domain-containing protein [Myxococcota bacterium]|nr:GGDEF domain-containing protein [Myxococcales bacterium]HPG24063.1 GGDEF domain-containing protein [Myxococcota bacterium]